MRSRSVFAAPITIVLAVVLAACGGSDPSPTATPAPTPTAAPGLASPTSTTGLPTPTATIPTPAASATSVPVEPTVTVATGQTIAIAIVEPTANFNSWTYDPADIIVHVGDTIIWTNTGAAAHTATADDGVTFDSGTLKPNETFSFTFTTAGTYSYHCIFHAWMTATITVIES